MLSGLTLGDYLLWNWSLSGNHDVLALVAGLSLLPLALACLWLLTVTVARLLARSTRRARAAGHRGRAQHPLYRAGGSPSTGVPAGKPTALDQPPAAATSSSVPSPGKLAA